MISIIFPFKNSEKYLKESLESILNQTEMNWELLAANDHSVDDSLKILNTYASYDKRIKVFNNEGNGIIEALKTAYQHSGGNFIHRMDSDDIMPENKLEILLKEIIKAGKGYFVTGKVKYFSDQLISQGYLDYQNWLNSLCDKESHWENIYKECVIASPAWIIHRDDFDKCGAFNSSRYPEDYDLVFRFYQYGMKVTSLNKIVHYWREHSQRTSRNHDHYNQQSFFRLKLYYFLQLERNSGKKLFVLGAGIKGVIVHDILNELQISHSWLGKNDDEKSLKYISSAIYNNDVQVIILFSEEKAQMKIREYFETLNMIENKDFFFFR